MLQQSRFGKAAGCRCVAALLFVGVVACRDEVPTGTGPALTGQPALAERLRPPTMDEEYEALVDSIPGFGGWFVDENGEPTVVLIDTSAFSVAQQRLAPRLARTLSVGRLHGERYGRNLRVQRGTFDFRQLREWSRIAERVLDTERDAVYLDVNEQRNLVEVGVSSEAAAGTITSALDLALVPRQAYEVKIVPAVKNFIDITGRLRPIPGGVYIHSSVTGDCTLGFNTSLSFSVGLVTAAHCTPVMGSLQNATDFEQHFSAFNNVAHEYWDYSPWQTTPDCTFYRLTNPNGVCRYADAAFADYQYIDPDSVQFGYIARTTFRAPLNTSPGSRTIDPSNSRFEIAGKLYSIPQGLYLDRIGPIAGWTVHNVSHACTTVYGPGTGGGAKMWCQHLTGGGNTAFGGDSGGPLWAYQNCDNGLPTRPDGTACVALAGVFWGGTGNNRLVFSQIHNIEIDFGYVLGVRPADNPFP